MTTTQVAFIGLGRMGVPMAANLLRAGFAVRGFDLAANAGPELDTLGAFTRCASAADAARGAQVVILMLPDSKIVDSLLWQGETALAGKLGRGTLVVDMSSSDPLHSRVNAGKLAGLSLGFVDAPVSGGVKRAIDGSLAIMAGGMASDFVQARPVLEAMGKKIIHVGEAGAGHAVKALNNYVSASGLIAVSESLAAAKAFGIDPKLVNEVFNASTGKNNTTEHKVDNFMLSGKYDSGFALALMRKDVQTAADFITGMGTPHEFAQKCLAVSKAAEEGLEPGADHTAVHKWINQPR